MGLAISFVSTVPEKVWYHTCPSKGKNCHNTKLLEQNGCCKWYTEMTYLADIEEHLGRKERLRLFNLLLLFYYE
jgi:ATP-dependent RNA helicase DDX1